MKVHSIFLILVSVRIDARPQSVCNGTWTDNRIDLLMQRLIGSLAGCGVNLGNANFA